MAMGHAENGGNLDQRSDNWYSRFQEQPAGTSHRKALMTRRVQILVNMIGAALAFLIVAPVIWTATDRTSAYTVHSIRVEKSPVAEGDVVALLWDVTVNRANCSGIYIREITDSTGVVRVYAAKPTTFVSLPIGRYTTHSANPLVVPNVSLGPATLTIRYETWCNWFQKLFPIVSTTQASFVVYPAKKPVDAGSDATVK